MTTIEEKNAHNWKYYLARSRGIIEEKCYDCDKWTIYGKTCKDNCIKE